MASLLQSLEKDIQRLKAQQAHKESTLTTIAPEEQERIRQQIEDVREAIARKRQQYFEELADLADDLTIQEPEAQAITVEMVEAVGQIEQRPEASAEMLELLREIKNQLDQPGPTAAAKLKGVISSFPPFIGLAYEAELDTEQFVRKYSNFR